MCRANRFRPEARRNDGLVLLDEQDPYTPFPVIPAKAGIHNPYRCPALEQQKNNHVNKH